MKFNIPNERDIFRWGPIPLKCTYAGTFFQVFQKENLAKHGFIWPDCLNILHHGYFVYIADAEAMRSNGADIFIRQVMVDSYFDNKRAMRQGVNALQDFYKSIPENGLAELGMTTFINSIKQFNELALAFELPTEAAELGNYGSISILREKLAEHIDDRPSLEQAIVMLTTSENPSFYQQEEFELQETADIETHGNKYFWLKNSYGHVDVLSTNFFEERKAKPEHNLRAHFAERAKEIRREKGDLQRIYKLPESVLAIADRIVDAMEFQDERKAAMLNRMHFIDLYMQECGRRGVDHPDRYTLKELAEILEGKRVADRDENFGFVLKDGDLLWFGTGEANAYWDRFAQERAGSAVSEFSGVVASKGAAVRGYVRIILNPESEDAYEFKKGEILIAPMTSPEYVFLMKRAAAIVTDTGGLTSHAAIVSRELGVPCIVGTKIATSILKDGDMVDVDTETGLVKKL